MGQTDTEFEISIGEHESPSVTVVSAIASIRGCSPVQLPPLYDTIDPDSLDQFVSILDSHGSSNVSITFRYNGYRVTVQSSQTVKIVPTDK